MRKRLDLNGTWEFELDPDESGIEDAWERRERFADTIAVPGCWQRQHKRLPAAAEHTHFRHALDTLKDAKGTYLLDLPDHYESAWYARQIEIPWDWAGSEIRLVCDGIAPSARFWLDGHPLGEHRDGPWLPARIPLTERVRQGGSHRLVVAVSEETRILQGVVKSYFSGLWKSVCLESTGPVTCDELHARGDPGTGEVIVEAAIGRAGKTRTTLEYTVEIAPVDGSSRPLSTRGVVGRASTLRVRLRIRGARPWTPETPHLYQCAFTLLESGRPVDARTTRFGFRLFSTEGRKILLNGKPIFLRGCGCAGSFQVEDPAPSSDSSYWRQMLARVKEYGYNWLRWHSCVLPHECLDAADEMGVMISSELFLTLWETPRERQLTERQWTMLIKEFRNHPSIWVWSMGNEQDSPDPEYLRFTRRLYGIAKRMSPDVLVTTSDGIAPTSRHEEPNDVYMTNTAPVGSVLDVSTTIRLEVASVEKPIVVHEVGYAESLPKTDSISKVRDRTALLLVEKMLAVAEEKNLGDRLQGWIANSERLVTRSYGKAMEDLRTCDGLAGYNQWVFRDNPGEYSGLVGPWHEDKAGMDPERARQINGPTAILMTPLENRYTLADGESFRFLLHVSHHGSSRLSGRLRWRLLRGERALDSGSAPVSVPPVRVARLGPFVASNPSSGRCAKLRLEASLSGPGIEAKNQWDLWSFAQDLMTDAPVPVRQLVGAFAVVEDRPVETWPFITDVREPAVPRIPADSLLLAPVLLPGVVDHLLKGGRVVYCPTYYLHNSTCLPSLPSSWHNLASWSGTDGNCGTFINPHPALGDFPHDGWADLNWYDLMSGARDRQSAPYWNVQPRVYDLDAWPRRIEPIIGSIGYCTRLSNRAYLFEANVGKGKLFAVELRLYEALGTRPEARYLFDRILRYATGPDFRPEASVSAEEFGTLLGNQTGFTH